MKISVADFDDQDQSLSIQEQVEAHMVFVNSYINDVQGAIRFAANPDPEIAWGLLQVGAAIANLVLIQREQVSDHRSWHLGCTRWIDTETPESYIFLRANDYMRFL